MIEEFESTAFLWAGIIVQFQPTQTITPFYADLNLGSAIDLPRLRRGFHPGQFIETDTDPSLHNRLVRLAACRRDRPMCNLPAEGQGFVFGNALYQLLFVKTHAPIFVTRGT